MNRVAASDAYESERQAVEQIRAARTRIGTELGKVIVGQREVIEQL
ncbi:MAG: AAA family ATPase, partial [Planctomycetes bacterium]|nr:AAA family ATPase [Planctomycetota bacterium]